MIHQHFYVEVLLFFTLLTCVVRWGSRGMNRAGAHHYQQLATILKNRVRTCRYMCNNRLGHKAVY